MQLTRDEEAASILRSLRRLVHGLRLTSHTVETDLGLTGAQLFLLRELALEPGASIRRLAERTMTDPSSVSAIVARLVEGSLVVRTRDLQDHRRSVLHVSKPGQAMLRRAPEPYQAKLFEAIHALPRQRLRELHRGLAALFENSTQDEFAAPLFFEDDPSLNVKKREER